MSIPRLEVAISRSGKQRVFTLVVTDKSGGHAEVHITKRDAAMLLGVIAQMLGDDIHSKYRVRKEQ